MTSLLQAIKWLLPATVRLGLLFLAATALGQGHTAEPDHPFRFGFLPALVQDVNENDFRASMKVWAEALTKDGAVNIDQSVIFYRDRGKMIDALQSGAVDGVAIPTPEFFLIRNQVKFNHYLLGVTEGSVWDEYVLLVHAQSDINRLEDLQGRSFILLRHPAMCLAAPWLDTCLLEKGLKPMDVFCHVTEVSKITKTVLSVFFKQADACIVTRKAFKTMCELNPQVGRQLRVLASSPKFGLGGLFMREGCSEAQQAKLIADLLKVHTKVSGKQVLTVFHSERMEEHPASVMDSAIELMVNYRRLSSATNSIPTVPAGIPSQKEVRP